MLNIVSAIAAVYFVSVGPSGLAIAGFAVRRNPQ